METNKFEDILAQARELLNQTLQKITQNAETTLYQMEEEVEKVMAKVSNVVLQGAVSAQGSGFVGPQRRCECTKLQKYYDKRRPMYVRTSFGEIQLPQRAYYHCPNCKRYSVPLDERLGLNKKGQMSRYLQDQVSWLYARMPGQAVRQTLERFGRAPISGEQIRKLAVGVGQEIDEHLNKKIRKIKDEESWQVPVSRTRQKPDNQTRRLYLAPDGWMYCTRLLEPETGKMIWREMKVGAIYEAKPGSEPLDLNRVGKGDRERIAKFAQSNNPQLLIAPADVAHKITYVARTETWEQSGAYLLAELKERGLGRGINELIVVADGAPRIDGVVEGQLRSPKYDLTRILDLPHAQEHVWKVSKLAFGEGSVGSIQWSHEPLQALEEGNVEKLTHLLNELAKTQEHKPNVLVEIQRAIAYFSQRSAQIAYPEFVTQGYQIGSGLAESACKRFGTDRMKGAGMRWTVEGAQATANLRMMALSERWDEVSDICRRQMAA